MPPITDRGRHQAPGSPSATNGHVTSVGEGANGALGLRRSLSRLRREDDVRGSDRCQSRCDVLAAPAHTSEGENDSKSMRHAGSEDTLCEDCILSGPGIGCTRCDDGVATDTGSEDTLCGECILSAPAPAPSVVTPCDELKMLHVASVV
ncbi:hypothetical protein Purlil1_12679 [Purpureocillium lilacinum]|uniref:Uncharacterized protein n=1 Tax=Purpureocillium lilacinum TaxID=33203 RepID=A0ABR0BG69_PURLI|nr:hypothetical protein Purlil1_12679 [Purpureocillium lilacinum]